jgi:RNA polymerase sigma factor (sigma-70 family)
MTMTRSSAVLRHIRELSVLPPDVTDDRQLLERFTAHRDEAAFTALVRRHGPMVLGVCRRVLHNAHDAEDAFQATFLVLARKAGSIRRRESISGWLYRVGYCMALKARAQAAARQKREARAARPEETDPLAQVTGRELLAVFDEELQSLPTCERAALVLCYLQGRTADEAAREVGCSESTLKRRLERGKMRMRKRLARRGMTLPAVLLAAGLTTSAKAMVPGPLITTAVQAGLLVAAGELASGVASATAAALANDAIGAMMVSKVKTIGALLLAVTLLGISTGLLAFASPEPPLSLPSSPARKEAKPSPTAGPKATHDNQMMTVAGRVFASNGRPLPGAEVAVLATEKGGYRGGDLSSGKPHVLGLGKADAQGRFRLDVPRLSSARVLGLALVAGSAGPGLGWQSLDSGTDQSALDLHLAPEQVIRGRFINLQGQPAVGVTVRLSSVRPVDYNPAGIQAPAVGKEPPCWPKAAVTDEDGRFEVRGVGRDTIATLGISDDRFATQSVPFATGGENGAKEVVTVLEPAHLIEGTVTYADTGKPVPGARLTVYAARSEHDGWLGLDGRADEMGRFHLIPLPGNSFEVSAYAPDGEPYLTLRRRLKWPKAAVKQQVHFQLPRGVLVCGRVMEAGAQKPVPKAIVQFIPRRADNPNFRKDAITGWENAVLSGEDGRFALCVLPGPGHLLIHGPTTDYIFSEIGDGKLHLGKEGGTRYYAHAIVPLDLKSGAGTYEATVTLKRGVTVKGRIVGPDGGPVAEALMLSRLNVDPRASYWRGFAAVARAGRFELHGCDPKKSYPVCFLDVTHKAGATFELSGKQAGEDVTIHLLPCGGAATRLVDADGKPLANCGLQLELVVTLGASSYDLKRLYEKGELAADSAYGGNIDNVNYRKGPVTDAEGRITFPALIPGATYRIVEIGDRDDIVKCEFKAVSGKTVKLPEVVRKKRP